MDTTNPRRMTKRGRNGARSRQFHAVPDGLSRYRVALCGTRPAATGAFGAKGIMGESGWSANVGKQVTCAKCLALQNAAQKAA